MTFKLIIVAVVLLSIAVAGIAIKMFFVKNAEFRKSCSSIDPVTGNRLDCSCGGNSDSSCDNN